MPLNLYALELSNRISLRIMKRLLYWALVLFVLADLGFTFVQQYHMPLDGDLLGGIVPAPDVKPVLQHPLGLHAVFNDTMYPNPNRHFSHMMLYMYFNHVPGMLQSFTDPVDSVYLASAIVRTLMHAALILLLGWLISRSCSYKRLSFMIAVALVTPLFQTNGFRAAICIVDPSITYTFFYALPVILLGFYLSPLFFELNVGRPIRGFKRLRYVWPLFTLPVCLSGPLNPGVILVLLLVLVARYLFTWSSFKARKISADTWNWLLFPAALVSLYSLWLGNFNSINPQDAPGTWELYKRMPHGLWMMISEKPALPMMIGLIILNFITIKLAFRHQSYRFSNAIGWAALFIGIYLAVLPLGGYRVYRPDVVRYDTTIPITLTLMFLAGYSSLFLLRKLSRWVHLAYVPLLVVFLWKFEKVDNLGVGANSCERAALEYISKSNDAVVPLRHDCQVMSWGKIKAPDDYALGGEMLQRWGITDEYKRYYHEDK